MRQGGVCAKCHQVWIAMDTATVTTAWDTGSQKESARDWLISQSPHTQTRASCGSCRITYFYCICFMVLLIGVAVAGYVLYKVL